MLSSTNPLKQLQYFEVCNVHIETQSQAQKNTTYIYYLAFSSFILQRQNQDRLVQLDWPLM